MADTSTFPAFVRGLQLCEEYYHQIVAPILNNFSHSLNYSAGLIGEGSEILGYDTPMSMDHDWGPRLMIFLNDKDFHLADKISHHIETNLPLHFKGFPTRFEKTNDSVVRHRVTIWTVTGYLKYYLHLDHFQPERILHSDWLSFPTQKLLGLTEGKIFHDDPLIDLKSMQKFFEWYPNDVYFFIISSIWHRIGQEEHLMARAAFVGDELGSSIIGSRLVRDLMRLYFFLSEKYPPYPKWFGTAFQRLDDASSLAPILMFVQMSATWKEREMHLSKAYELLAKKFFIMAEQKLWERYW